MGRARPPLTLFVRDRKLFPALFPARVKRGAIMMMNQIYKLKYRLKMHFSSQVGLF